MSYKIEVIADSSGIWADNSLRFKTEEEAKDYGLDLKSRWTAVRKIRTVASEDSVSHRWDARFRKAKTSADAPVANA